MSITLGGIEYGISIQGHMHFLCNDFMQMTASHSWMLGCLRMLFSHTPVHT